MPRSGVIVRACVAAAAWGVGAAGWGQPPGDAADPAVAQPADDGASGGRRPALAGRLVAVFDFEEQQTNPLPVPRHWVRAQSDADGGAARAGFPSWNQGELDYTTACGGIGSVRLPTRGGSTSLRLEPGVLPVFVGADYAISVRTRTQGLSHARPGLTARLLDAQGAPIPGSERRALGSARVEHVGGGTPPWETLALHMRADREGAAYLQIDLELLQPEHAEAPRLGPHQVWEQDLSGSVWFDDLVIAQSPRVELRTPAPGNVLGAGEPIALRVSVQDLTGERLRARLEVRDASGRVAGEETRDLPSGGAEMTWEPSIDRFGWYRATLTVTNGEQAVGWAHTDFVRLPPLRQGRPGPGGPGARGDEPAAWAGSASGRRRLGVIVEDLPVAAHGVVPPVLRALGSGAATVPVWRETMTRADADRLTDDLSPLIDALLADWQEVTLSLPRVPRDLAEPLRASPIDVYAAFGAGEEAWSPYLADLLDRYGQAVQRWQLGRVSDEWAAWMEGRDAALHAVDAALSEFVPGPELTLPWPADQSILGSQAGTARTALALRVSRDAPPEAIPLYAQGVHEEWTAMGAGAGPRPGVTFVLETLPAERFGAGVVAADLLKRAVYAWSALGAWDAQPPEHRPRLAIVDPWEWRGGERGQLMPGPALAAWGTAVRQLSERRVAGRLDGEGGVVCFVLRDAGAGDDESSGALVAWSDGGRPGAALSVPLGAGPVTIADMFGNRSSLAPATPTGEYEIPLGPEPVFVEGVNVPLVLFASGVSLDPGLARATGEVHEHEVVIRNPWALAISGRFSILSPGGAEPGERGRDRTWQITPRVGNFGIEPGGEARIPLTLSFGSSVDAGAVDFVMEFDLDADRMYRGVVAHVPLRIGLEGLDVDARYVPAPSAAGPDVVAIVRLANTGTEALSLDLAAAAPGHPRQRSSVTDLPPGQHAERVFVFARGLESLRGTRILVTIGQPGTPVRLSKSIPVE